ncbi:O-antigen ligase family protein [bacterium]|nr:O-antigen ligase family protein [bacterium]
MTRSRARSPRVEQPAPVYYHYPAVCLFFLFILLSISHLYPQAAYPLHGVAIGAGLVLVFAATGFHHAARRWRGQGRPLLIAAAVASIAWVGWWALRQLDSPLPAQARIQLAQMFQGTLVFLTAMSAIVTWPRRDFRPIGEEHHTLPPHQLAAMWLGGLTAFLALFAIYQVIGPPSLPFTYRAQEQTVAANPQAFDPASYEGILHALRERRAASRLGSPNVFAGLIAIAMPLIVALAFGPGKARARWFWRAAGLWTLWALVLSGSRGGVLGTFAGLVLMGALVLLRRGSKAPLAAVGLLASGWLLTAAAGPAPLSGSRWFGITTVQQRVSYWTSGVQIWSENWLLGAGPGSFAAYYPQHRLPGANETAFAHNWIVQWGTEVGILGLAVLLVWLVAVLALGIRWWRAAGRESLLPAAFVAAGGAALAHGLIEFTLSTREIYLDTALVLGVLVGMGARLPLLSAKSGRRALQLAFVGIVVVAGAASWWMCELRPAGADFYRTIAEERAEDPDDRVAAYTEALGWQPDDPRLYESRAFARRAAGDPRAIDDLRRALKLAPFSARLHQSLALFEVAAGNLDEAIRLQREAVRLHPLDATHRLVLAEFLWQAGEKDEARELVASTSDLNKSKLEDAHRERLVREYGVR